LLEVNAAVGGSVSSDSRPVTLHLPAIRSAAPCALTIQTIAKEKPMKKLLIVIALSLLGVSVSALAECEKDGKKYKTGDKVGPFTCMPDGKWSR
jgi:hypothetical protein